MPALDPLLVRDGVIDGLNELCPNQPVQIVFGAEFRTFTLPMLRNPRCQISCNADINRPSIAIGHDVNPAAASLLIHKAYAARSWTPDQVRGDEMIVSTLLYKQLRYYAEHKQRLKQSSMSYTHPIR